MNLSILPKIKFGDFCPVDMILERGFETFPKKWIKTQVHVGPFLIFGRIAHYHFPVKILREIITRTSHFTETTGSDRLHVNARSRHGTFEITIYSKKLSAKILEEIIRSLEIEAMELRPVGFYLRKNEDLNGYFSVQLILNLKEYQRHLDSIELRFMDHVTRCPFETMSRSRYDPMAFHYITQEHNGPKRFNKIRMRTPVQIKRNTIRDEYDILMKLRDLGGFPANPEFTRGDDFDLLSSDRIDGRPLSKSWVNRLTAGEKREVMEQVKQLLGQLNNQGILHADLYPENFVVDKKLRVHLVDFDQSLTFQGSDDWTRQFEYSFCPLDVFLKNSGLNN